MFMNQFGDPISYHDTDQYLNLDEDQWEELEKWIGEEEPEDANLSSLLLSSPLMPQPLPDMSLPPLTMFGCNLTDVEFHTTAALNQLLQTDNEEEGYSGLVKEDYRTLASLYDEYEHEQSLQPINPLLSYAHEEIDDPELMVPVDLAEITGEKQEDCSGMPYEPLQDHSYSKEVTEDMLAEAMAKESIVKKEIDPTEIDVDVWNDDPGQISPPIAESDPPSPLPFLRTRRTRGSCGQVSINTAATKALKGGTKRRRPGTAMAPRKQRKVGNSLETSPSGSDSEDPVMPPPRRAPAKRAAPKKGAKPTKSELQRNTHNLNEKMRRNEMTNMLHELRKQVPPEYFPQHKTTRAKASKQKILSAATAYVNDLKAINRLETDSTSYEYMYHVLKEELSLNLLTLDKVVKKYLDKYAKVNGYKFAMRHKRHR